MTSGQKKLQVATRPPVCQSLSVTGGKGEEGQKDRAKQRSTFGEKGLRKERE